ncbi:MAG: AbrB/MazE/SpoVT family DNA-binding domain-containing protein [Armatimonadetes bacterium]|nr:AbrB/MazE/SpoVT family DNA-binding domain-containing protein [Armatimonadota bacterium]
MSPDKKTLDECFYGSATIGERGQLVIPAEAREELGFKPGDKVLVMRHKVWDALVITKLDKMKMFMEEFAQSVEMAESLEAE